MKDPIIKLKVSIGLVAIGLGGLITIAIVTKISFIGNYYIPQNGMYPTLPAGSHIFAAKRAYSKPSDVKRGDIVVFTQEENGEKYVYIWRVVGLPGETVETYGESLMINGQEVQRKQLREHDGKIILQEHNGDATYEIAFDRSLRFRPPEKTITVPAGEFFVMGDNRNNAIDSRTFGAIPFSSIIGRKLQWVP